MLLVIDRYVALLRISDGTFNDEKSVSHMTKTIRTPVEHNVQLKSSNKHVLSRTDSLDWIGGKSFAKHPSKYNNSNAS